ncbi:hypothetical protein [Paraburkholderia sp. JPY419]|uniref:hypothetical protein n=1 Tax=Paraburkholderia sp. JPY419 TaxID=667660 RepID=UPI003D19AD07
MKTSETRTMAADRNVLPRLSSTFDEWLRTTSRAMHVRSASLKALEWSSLYLETVGYKSSSNDNFVSALIKPG